MIEANTSSVGSRGANASEQIEKTSSAVEEKKGSIARMDEESSVERFEGRRRRFP